MNAAFANAWLDFCRCMVLIKCRDKVADRYLIEPVATGSTVHMP
jgi:hypothetical protein